MLMPDPGASRMPASPASMKPMIQAKPAMRLVRAPVSEARLRVVDHRPHGHAHAGPLEQHPQRDGDGHGAADRDQLLVGEVDPEHADLVALANQSGRLRVIVWFQMVETSP